MVVVHGPLMQSIDPSCCAWQKREIYMVPVDYQRLGSGYFDVFFFAGIITLPPAIMVQWKVGVSPTLVSFHLG